MTGGRIKRLARYLDGRFMVTYGDGVADVDLDAAARVPRAHGRLATVTAVRPPARFGGLDHRRRPRHGVQREAAGGEAGSTAASSSSSAGARLPRRRRRRPRARAARAPCARGPAVAYRHDGLLAADGHPARPGSSNRVGIGRGARGRSGMTDAVVPVRRAEGLRYRGHRHRRRLAGPPPLDPEPTSLPSSATERPVPSSYGAATSERVTRVRGDAARTGGCWSGSSSNTRCDVGISPGAQTQVVTARRDPVRDASKLTYAARTYCSTRSVGAIATPSGGSRVQRQGIRRVPSAARIRRTTCWLGAVSTTSSKSAADLIATAYARPTVSARDRSLREHLRRRRPNWDRIVPGQFARSFEGASEDPERRQSRRDYLFVLDAVERLSSPWRSNVYAGPVLRRGVQLWPRSTHIRVSRLS